MKRLGRILSNILLIFCTVCVLSCAVTFFINDKDFTRANVLGYKFTFVMSESMEPEIMTHALCLIHVFNNADDEDIEENINVGDIIVYKCTYEDGTKINIIHRVIAIVDGGYITKGDNNENADADVVAYSQVIGTAEKWWNGFAELVS